MNLEIKKQWVAALRSGEYEQGFGVLREAENKYCCLGVLTDLFCKSEEGIRSKVKMEDYEHWARLPHSIQNWAQIDNSDPIVVYSYPNTTNKNPWLSSLNDGLGGFPKLSFNEIADIIEKQL